MNAQTMFPYQSECLNSILSFCDVSQKDILEIGGAPPYSVAHELSKMDAKSVTIVDYRPDLTDRQLSDHILFYNMDARGLKFENGSFDLIYGIAILEHLPDIDVVLSELHRVVRKGGCVWLHGGPFWSCNLGHHVYVHVDGVRYEFNGYNPVPDWHHLIFDKAGMLKYLQEDKQIHLKAATSIVEYIYDDAMLNRYHYEDIVSAIHRSAFVIQSVVEHTWKTPSDETLELLQRRLDHPSFANTYRNYSTGDMEVLLIRKS